MTFPIDHGQQLFAYLQAWRQLLEPLAAMTPGNPYSAAPWGLPAMPPMPPAAPFTPPVQPAAPMPTPQPVPPTPKDYTQELFGHLQAWRAYLEQMTGAAPAPSATTPDEGGSAQQVPPPSRPRVPIPPPVDTGGQIQRGSLYADDQSSNSPWPPHDMAHPPANEGGTQVPDELASATWRREVDLAAGGEPRNAPRASRQAAEMARGPQESRLPSYEAGNPVRGRSGPGRDSVHRTDATAAVRSGARSLPSVRSLYGLQ